MFGLLSENDYSQALSNYGDIALGFDSQGIMEQQVITQRARKHLMNIQLVMHMFSCKSGI